MQFKVFNNTPNIFEFSWTISDWSGKKSPCGVEGPTFSPNPMSSEKYFLQVLQTDCYSTSKSTEWLTVYLRHCNVEDVHHNVFGYIRLYSIDGTIFADGEYIFAEKIKKQTLLLHAKSPCDSPSKLLRDSIIMKGSLTFSNNCLPPTEFVQISEDLKTMYRSGLSSDIAFSFGGETLRAHKAILAARAPMFYKTFEQDLLKNNTSSVVIKGIDYDVFDYFLFFLYTGVAEDWEPEAVISLYSIAFQYQVKGLQKACSSMLAQRMTNDTFCSVLVISHLHGDHKLKENSKSFFQKNSAHIVKTINWVEVVATKPDLASEVLACLKS